MKKIMVRESIGYLFLGFMVHVVTFQVTAMSPEKLASKPNIIIIFMDDMGLGDLGCFGAIGYQTPNIDKLASEGMRLTNFHTPQATCTASRAALLTGCYPNRIGMYGAFSPGLDIGLSPDEVTIADLLKEQGYSTAMVGKWHLGNKPAFLPTKQGFDEYLGLPYSNDMWPVNYDGKPVSPDHPKYQRYPPLPLLESRSSQTIPDTNRIVRNLEDQGELTAVYTKRAVDFIRQERESPFFLYVAHSMPHVPIMASKKFKGKSQMGLYGDVMMELDWSVGEILKTLKSLDIEDNTLVILTSDNGPWLNYGNHGGSTTGLREGKGTSWEGGTHVPCIMRWPRKIAPGSISNKLASTIDILPSIAAITKATLPSKKIDGVSILSLLTQQGEESEPRKVMYYYYHKNDLEAVRKGHWKLVFPHNYRSYEQVLPGSDGYPGSYNKGVQESIALFDLRRDPGERYDVKDSYPTIVQELQDLASAARIDLGDDLTGYAGENRRLP